MDCVYISEGSHEAIYGSIMMKLYILRGGFAMKKIQLFLKYLVLMLFLIVWIIIMFFTDCMNSQAVKLYCMFVVGCGCAYSIWEKTYVPDARSYIAEKAISLILIVTVFIRLLCF